MSQQPQTGFVSETDSASLYGKPGLDLLLVQTPLCRAVIARQGAQLLEFRATDRAPLLWLSPRAQFEPGIAIRGGIPLCMPWFGEHSDPKKPKHGLVRTETWELASTRELPGGELEWVFTYRHSASELFSAPFTCEFSMVLGSELQLSLKLRNNAAERAEFAWAWHSYFAVGDVREIRVKGLEGCDYRDKIRDLQKFTLEEALTFSGEVDRVFENAPARQEIVTDNPISARSENCHSVITWNPGEELATSMDDVGEHYREYVCVEHGNVFANSWLMEPGETALASLVLAR